MDMPDLLNALLPPVERPGDISLQNTAPVTADETEDAAKFDWNSDDSVIIAEQLAVAVYRNRAGGIVIRQEARNFDDDDAFVVLRDTEAVRLVIKALRREAEGGA
ncbi:hypothetical protein ACSBOB_11440 [Mesorhizobium sp. ASY16-5R]|uniref:hypothetical protein n=1 Tax=Mesorhizobium sp. ASY16-5R TaxID=3445772 RepID=UPI003F9EF216